MSKKQKQLCGLTLLAVVLLTCGILISLHFKSDKIQAGDTVIALINNQPITKDYVEYYKVIEKETTGTVLTDEESIRNIAKTKLLIEDAKKRGIYSDEEELQRVLQNQIAYYSDASNFTDETAKAEYDKFQAFLTKTGLSAEEYFTLYYAEMYIKGSISLTYIPLVAKELGYAQPDMPTDVDPENTDALVVAYKKELEKMENLVDEYLENLLNEADLKFVK
ncbi:MAG: hypothetical protein LBO63_04795 [Oscillospiraceae bacterium]|jgi:hypothetical protein|nr:hypothetical protein [Oscillospiraceae bacterium]